MIALACAWTSLETPTSLYDSRGLFLCTVQAYTYRCQVGGSSWSLIISTSTFLQRRLNNPHRRCLSVQYGPRRCPRPCLLLARVPSPRPHRIAQHSPERDAVRPGSRPRDDIRVVHPVAVAVEAAVVDHDRAVAHEGVRSCRGVENQPDVARVAL